VLEPVHPLEPANKPERPRDELGRPLPWGSENRLHLPDFESFDIETNHRLAVEHFNAGQFFAAHEAWEVTWKLARGTPDEEFFKGLSQLGAGYTHYLRGNAHGVVALLGRAVERLLVYASRYGERYRGVALLPLAAVLELHIAACRESEERNDLPPTLDPPHIEFTL
jgi:hypothetical protein